MAKAQRLRRAALLVGGSALVVVGLGVGATAIFAPGLANGEALRTDSRLGQSYLEGLAWERAQLADTTPPPPAPALGPLPPKPNTAAARAAIAYARAQLGEPYEFGAMGQGSWDCSGLTKASYASVGVHIGAHGATDQFNTLAAAARLVPLAELEIGDLLWYSANGAIAADKYHTAMYVGDGEMIEAARPGTFVRIVPLRYGDLVPYAGRPTP